VVPVPGPSALIAALIAAAFRLMSSSLPVFCLRDRTHVVLGSASCNQCRALDLLRSAASSRATLKDAYEILGEREAVVRRELTKLTKRSGVDV
jgi:16S rRNA C1402 (ribose-2'-O) methylase RsmI